MIVLVHWLMLVLFVGWGAFFVFVLFRFRKGANPKASYAGAKGKFAKGIEIAVVVVEMVLLVVYAIPAWAHARRRRSRRERGGRRPRRRRAVRVERPLSRRRRQVRPHATSSSCRPTTRSASIARDPDAKDDITTINQLNLPVDRPVLVHLSSKDVIHSFGLLEMRVKQDAIPGLDIPVWFIPNRIGDYEIACSQLCGLGPLPDARLREHQDRRPTTRASLAEEAKSLLQQ